MLYPISLNNTLVEILGLHGTGDIEKITLFITPMSCPEIRVTRINLPPQPTENGNDLKTHETVHAMLQVGWAVLDIDKMCKEALNRVNNKTDFEADISVAFMHHEHAIKNKRVLNEIHSAHAKLLMTRAERQGVAA